MRIFFLIFLLAFSLESYSQKVKLIPVDEFGNEIPNDTSKWMGKYEINILKSIKLNYKTPDVFSEISGVECFENYPKLQSMFGCADNQLLSKDEQFLVFIPLHRFFTKEDSISFKKSLPGMDLPNLNNQHAFQIRAQILLSLGKDASVRGENANFDWRKYVQYSPKEAKEKFNADTAITYSVKLNDDELYKDKYRFLKVLVLQKRDRGLLSYTAFIQTKEQKN